MKFPASQPVRHVTSEAARTPIGLPGILPATSVTALSAILCLAWLLSDVATKATTRGSIATSEIAAVDDQDITGALTTLGGSSAFVARFKQRPDGCSLPLAWVAVSPVAGQTSGTICVISGGYFSPVFKLSDAPLRIAIPYPAPYETEHGTLTVLHTGGDATITLHPGWRLLARESSATHAVTWHSGKRCKPAMG